MGVVSRRWMWVESIGVVVRWYRLPNITYPYSSFFFAAASLLFVNKKKRVFRSCSSTFL